MKLINFDKCELACLSKKLSYTQLQQDLDRYEDNIGFDGASTLAGGLKSLAALKCPDRSGHYSTFVDACGLKFFNSLQCLDLSSSNIDSDGFSALADGYKYMTRLEKLYLNHNNISCNSAKAIAGGFKYMARLKELYLCKSKIGPDVATALACGIEFLTALRKLDLSHNNIGPDGAAALAGKFKFLSSLRKLDLSYNNIGPNGAVALAHGFKFLTLLHMLDLSDNNIGSDGAITLADGLCCLTELRRCKFRNNNITLPGAKAVITSLKECEHLEQLAIEGWAYATRGTCYIVMSLHPGNTAAISELTKVAQHNFKQIKLDLGFKTIMVAPKCTTSEN